MIKDNNSIYYILIQQEMQGFVFLRGIAIVTKTLPKTGSVLINFLFCDKVSEQLSLSSRPHRLAMRRNKTTWFPSGDGYFSLF